MKQTPDRRSKRVVSLTRMRPVDLLIGRLLYPETPARPSTRGECRDGIRPCPFVACRHHLYLGVKQNSGNLDMPRPDLEPWELTDSCSLDVAERGPHELVEIGRILGMTRQRLAQIEAGAIQSLRRSGVLDEAMHDLE